MMELCTPRHGTYRYSPQTRPSASLLLACRPLLLLVLFCLLLEARPAVLRQRGERGVGVIVEGEEIVDAMSEVETEYSIRLNANNVPIEPIVIKKMTVLPPL